MATIGVLQDYRLRKQRGDGPIRFRSNMTNVILDVLKGRGWLEVEAEAEGTPPAAWAPWDLMWGERELVYPVFETHHLDSWQRLNHFRNGRELCRKDLLAKNIKKIRRALEKDGDSGLGSAGLGGPGGVLPGSLPAPPLRGADFDFVPLTFVLPTEYALFSEEFKKPQHAGATWIMKPIGKSQGRGIFLFNKLSQIAQWRGGSGSLSSSTSVSSSVFGASTNTGAASGAASVASSSTGYRPTTSAATGLSGGMAGGGSASSNAGSGGAGASGGGGSGSGSGSGVGASAAAAAADTGPEAYVVQRYLDRPYLVGGKKFDMRIYAMCTAFSPLTVWVYRAGFARFTSSRYSNDPADITNTYVHLTNVAVQKSAEAYNAETGGKWELRQLKRFLAARHGAEACNDCFEAIQCLILRSLQAVSKVMINDRHCFEVYGYDIILDDSLKPWLLEVNASPSLTANTRDDYDLKYKMLNDALDIVDMEHRRRGDETSVGGFDLVWRDGPIPVQGSVLSGAGLQLHHPPPPLAAAATAAATASNTSGSSGADISTGGRLGPSRYSSMLGADFDRRLNSFKVLNPPQSQPQSHGHLQQQQHQQQLLAVGATGAAVAAVAAATAAAKKGTEGIGSGAAARSGAFGGAAASIAGRATTASATASATATATAAASALAAAAVAAAVPAVSASPSYRTGGGLNTSIGSYGSLDSSYVGSPNTSLTYAGVSSGSGRGAGAGARTAAPATVTSPLSSTAIHTAATSGAVNAGGSGSNAVAALRQAVAAAKGTVPRRAVTAAAAVASAGGL